MRWDGRVQEHHSFKLWTLRFSLVFVRAECIDQQRICAGTQRAEASGSERKVVIWFQDRAVVTRSMHKRIWAHEEFSSQQRRRMRAHGGQRPMAGNQSAAGASKYCRRLLRPHVPATRPTVCQLSCVSWVVCCVMQAECQLATLQWHSTMTCLGCIAVAAGRDAVARSAASAA